MNRVGDAPSTRLGKALGRLGTWYRNVLAGLTAHGEFETVLDDPGESPSRMDAILNAHPEASLRLTVMMRRLSLKRDDIRDGRMLREMELNCALCEETGDCRHWLQSKQTAGNHRFCPNARRFDRLLAVPK
jgi:hypothetical protein